MEEKIKSWKELHGKIYMSIIGGKTYYYKTLTRDDYMDILVAQASNQKFDHDIQVFKKCVLSEYSDEELTNKAGISTVISEKIMLLSGFESTEAIEV